MTLQATRAMSDLQQYPLNLWLFIRVKRDLWLNILTCTIVQYLDLYNCTISWPVQLYNILTSTQLIVQYLDLYTADCTISWPQHSSLYNILTSTQLIVQYLDLNTAHCTISWPKHSWCATCFTLQNRLFYIKNSKENIYFLPIVENKH